MAEENKKINGEKIKLTAGAVIRYLKMHSRATWLLSILTILAALGNGFIPYITGSFFDSIIAPGKHVSILFSSVPLYGALLAAWIIVQITTAVIEWQISIRSLAVNHNIWCDYMAEGIGKILLFPISFLKDNNPSSITHKMDMAAATICQTFVTGILRVAPKFLSLIIAFVVCYHISQTLLLTLICGLIVFAIAMYIGVKPLANFQEEFWMKLHKVWDDFSGVLDNTLTIKQSGTEKYEKARISKLFKDWMIPSFLRKDSVKINLNFYQKSIILLTQFAVFCVSLKLVISGQITIGSLLAFNAYTALAFGPLMEFGSDWQDIVGGIVTISETEKILKMPTENYQPEGYIKLHQISGNLSLKNVEFYYNADTPILKDISFDVKQGEVIALVGESGVGKSTLIDLISGYNLPQSGEILIDDVDIRKIDLGFLRRNIGVVPQEVVLFNDSIRKNISYGSFNVSDKEVKACCEKIGLTEFIEKQADGWDAVVGERGIKLSVGQKQRVAIARAMLRNPKILILDEPTSALDASTESLITEALEDLMQNKTTFVIAHRLSTVRKANKILVFKDGKITESGTHDELLKKKRGEYKRLYDLQIGLHK
ncbi:MAG: ABC transporter ATP-binding protein [bacterium]